MHFGAIHIKVPMPSSAAEGGGTFIAETCHSKSVARSCNACRMAGKACRKSLPAISSVGTSASKSKHQSKLYLLCSSFLWRGLNSLRPKQPPRSDYCSPMEACQGQQHNHNDNHDNHEGQQKQQQSQMRQMKQNSKKNKNNN